MDRFAIRAQLEASPVKNGTSRNFLNRRSRSRCRSREQPRGTRSKSAPHVSASSIPFPSEQARDAHLHGEIAEAPFARAQELFVAEPQIHQIEILAVKGPGS
jgi:hypothetical protein